LDNKQKQHKTKQKVVMSVSLFLGGWVVRVTKLLGPTPKTKGETKWKPSLVP
jgi:hypothetical protein